jgi:hypothetical protein
MNARVATAGNPNDLRDCSLSPRKRMTGIEDMGLRVTDSRECRFRELSVMVELAGI